MPKASGRLTEIYRRDWLTDTELVDQVFQVELLPGRIAAWHAHEQTLDRLFIAEGSARSLNLLDKAYDYASPDHWPVPADSPHVPFTFPR